MKLFALTVLVALFSSTALASELDRTIRILNVSNTTVVEIYGKPSSSSSWSEDLLGEDVLLSRREIVIDFADGSDNCVYDVKIVAVNDAVVYKTNYNVCKEIELFIFD